jgi:sulfate adenylyltransferase
MTAPPHGGRLVQVRESAPDSQAFGGFSQSSKLRVDPETRKTVWNIAQGVFSPIEGFMDESDYGSVLDQMRLGDDLPWTLPILLTTDRTDLKAGDDVLLEDGEGRPVAVMKCEGSFEVDKKAHAAKVFGTEDQSHPGVAKVYGGPGRAPGGKLKVVARPDYGPYSDCTLTPRETRVLFDEKGWKTVVAFQTRNAPHINHEYLQKTALGLVDGLFVNPVLGRKKPGDFRDDVIVSAYRALISNYYPRDSVVMSVLHYEMQYAGPKEAIMHAIMRKNFGCTHMIVGRDHAGVGNFYQPYAAQEIFSEFPDLGLSPLFFKEFYYCKKCAGIASERTCPHGEAEKLSFSGTKLRNMFSEGEVPPKEFMRPEVADAITRFEEPFVV